MSRFFINHRLASLRTRCALSPENAATGYTSEASKSGRALQRLASIRANQTKPFLFARPSRKVTKWSGTIPLLRLPSCCAAQMP